MSPSLGEKRNSKGCSYSTTKASTAITEKLEQKLTGISQPDRQARKRNIKKEWKINKKTIIFVR